MNENTYSRVATTIRLPQETATAITYLAEKTGSSQSDVIRKLLAIALADKDSIVIKEDADVPDDVKRQLLELADKLAAINTQLARIGNNINIRLRKYNGDRKTITDRISVLQKTMRYENSYNQAKHSFEIESLQQKLNEMDSQTTEMVSEDEWIRFQQVLQDYERISIEIGDKLRW